MRLGEDRIDTAMALFATRDYLDRCDRPAKKDDLKHHDLIGLDRSDLFIRGFASHGMDLTREEFALRTDDGT